MENKTFHNQNSIQTPLEQCRNTNNLSFVLFNTIEILDCSSSDFNIKKLKDDR